MANGLEDMDFSGIDPAIKKQIADYLNVGSGLGGQDLEVAEQIAASQQRGTILEENVQPRYERRATEHRFGEEDINEDVYFGGYGVPKVQEVRQTIEGGGPDGGGGVSGGLSSEGLSQIGSSIASKGAIQGLTALSMGAPVGTAIASMGPVAVVTAILQALQQGVIGYGQDAAISANLAANMAANMEGAPIGVSDSIAAAVQGTPANSPVDAAINADTFGVQGMVAALADTVDSIEGATSSTSLSPTDVAKSEDATLMGQSTAQSGQTGFLEGLTSIASDVSDAISGFGISVDGQSMSFGEALANSLSNPTPADQAAAAAAMGSSTGNMSGMSTAESNAANSEGEGGVGAK